MSPPTRIWLGIAIAIHLLSVVWWIGGLAFVTAVALPGLRTAADETERSTAFRRLEQRFGPQVRLAAILTGVSGGYLLWRLGYWRFLDRAAFWWLDAMMGYWVAFMLLLFVLEPSGVLARVRRGVTPDRAWQRLHRLHAVLLVAALVIIAGAAAGSHGF